MRRGSIRAMGPGRAAGDTRVPRTVHLLHGLPGSGKTRFARLLAHETGAECFTHDAWMRRLFGANPPAERFSEYFAQVSEMIWDLAARAIAADRDVILDFGFWTRRSRDEARQHVAKLGAAPKLYALICDEHRMLERVLARNARNEPDSLQIDEAAFRGFASRCEPPAEDERPIRVETTDHGYRILD